MTDTPGPPPPPASEPTEAPARKAPAASDPIARLLYLVSLVVALVAVWFASTAEKRAYRRVVDDTWQLVLPVYEDFGVALPPDDQPPETLEEALGPMLKLERTLQAP